MTKKTVIINKIKEILKMIKKDKNPNNMKVLRSLEEIYFDQNEAAWQLLGLSLKKAK